MKLSQVDDVYCSHTIKHYFFLMLSLFLHSLPSNFYLLHFHFQFFFFHHISTVLLIKVTPSLQNSQWWQSGKTTLAVHCANKVAKIISTLRYFHLSFVFSISSYFLAFLLFFLIPCACIKKLGLRLAFDKTFTIIFPLQLYNCIQYYSFCKDRTRVQKYLNRLFMKCQWYVF